MTTGFPIVSHIDLSPTGGRFLRKRDTTQLPTLRPHQVMVVATQGRYRDILPGTMLEPRDQDLIYATGITVVDVAHRVVPITVDLVSQDPSESFAITVHFSCKVTNPSTVVQEMFHGIDGPLEYWLAAQLRNAASQFVASDLAKLQAEARALLKAETEVSPIHLPGLRIDVNVENIDIRPPIGEAQVRERLAKHRRDHLETMETISLTSAGDVAKERARQTLQELVSQFDDVQVARMLSTIRDGPEAINARRVVTGEATLTRISEEQRDDRRFLTAALADVFNKFVDSGHLDESQMGDEVGEALLKQLLQSLKTLGTGAGVLDTGVAGLDGELTKGTPETGGPEPDAGT